MAVKSPRTIFPPELYHEFSGRLAKAVPIKIDFFEGLADEILKAVERSVYSATEQAVQGGRLAGQAAAMPDGEEAEVYWTLYGNAPDGKNCDDCVALHGKKMTMGEFLDIHYTTQCNGKCRCEPTDASGGPVEPITEDEVRTLLESGGGAWEGGE